MKKIMVWSCLCLAIMACQKSEDISLDSFIPFKKAMHFPEPEYQLDQNRVPEKMFQLGKKLFYDPILSKDNSISCGSCHISQHAFTHHGHDISHGIEDRLGIRNAMPLMNLAWSTSFFWDGGVIQLDLTAAAPIENHVEMDENLGNVIYKLRNNNEYISLFRDAFGQDEINSAQLFKALGSFMVMLISDNAKYDQVKAGKTSFTESEQQGYMIYKKNCSSCHQEPLFTDYSFKNNGLALNPAEDYGRYTITNQEEDKLKFKVPTLRNLRFTAPYMHDGRLYTLQAVLNHYMREIKDSPSLDPILKTKKSIEMTTHEQESLLAFLNTLNDESFIYNKKFAE